jgi:hypothetical protein
VAGVEDVNDAFSSIGAQASECGGTVSESYSEMASSAEDSSARTEAANDRVDASIGKVNSSYRFALIGPARLASQSAALGVVLEQVANGHLDLGRAALLLSTHLLYEAGTIYMLYARYGALLGVKASAIATNISEAASATAHTVAETARTAALWASNTAHGVLSAIKNSSIAQDAGLVAGAMAHAIAEGARQAAVYASVIAENALALASGIANAISSMGIAVPIMLAAAVAITVGVLAATGVIPTHEKGGLVSRRSITWIAEKEPELIIPVSRFNEYVTDSTLRVSILRSIGVHETESLPAFGSGGVIYSPTVALIAEHEPEAIVPLSSFHEFVSERIRDLTFAVSYSMPHLETQVPTIIAEGMAATAGGIEGLGLYKKASPLEFLTGPLAGSRTSESSTEAFTVIFTNPVFRSRSDLDYLIDRLKRMGMA